MLSITMHKVRYFSVFCKYLSAFLMKSELDKYIIDKVKLKRKELKISQRALAEILGCNRSFVGQVESDNYPAKYTAYQVYLIARDFECPVSDFFPSINDPKYNPELLTPQN